MAKELYSNAKRKVIPFEQNGEFFHRKAKKYVESNNYINALSFYRKAVEKEPDNIEYLMDLAEVFTEMGYFIESNKILFSVVHKNPSATDCYFGIGCNFLGMQEYKKAEDCFERYLDIVDYNGIYTEEALDLLDVLRNQEYYFDYLDNIDHIKERILRVATKGKDLLDKGDYKQAVKELEKVVKEEPNLIFARNNLSLAYYCIGEIDKAIAESKNILKINPMNVHANCNLALFYHEAGDKEKSRYHTDIILKLKPDDPEDIHKIAVTLCELKYHREANAVLKTLLQYKPYDIKVLHYMGISLFNLKNYKSALSYWNKIDKISPNNTISSFYKRFVQNCINGVEQFRELPYNFQVPYDEIVRRVKKINDILNLPSMALKEKWKNGNSLCSLLRWGLDLNDDLIKSAILNVVALFEDEKAEKFLRDFIFRKNESRELIKEALTLLKRMNAAEPYIAYIGNNIVEAKVSVRGKSGLDSDKWLNNIPQFAIDNMLFRYPEGFEDEIWEIWYKILNRLTLESIIGKKIEGWAAALELYYCIVKGLKVNKSALASIYSISYITMMNNYKTILASMHETEPY